MAMLQTITPIESTSSMAKREWQTPFITLIYCKQIACCKGPDGDTEGPSPFQT